MGNDFPPLEVKVWGDYALFTRPEMKVERVSYEVMTPSAARGVLRAIFWKPEFHWRVKEIEVLEPIQRMSIKRNEVKSKINPSNAKSWAKEGNEDKRYLADKKRTQRNSLVLRDVAYIIRANVELAKHAGDEHPAKFRDQFRRRLDRGQCFFRPYLGCREFSAHFAKPSGGEEPISRSDALGRMLFDIDYEGNGSGRGKPVFFQAKLESGRLRIPQHMYSQVRGGP
ncbi:MAG: type I-C CRISPR-associated protein Cas5c [Candidatus Acetothermia bacterium]